MLQIAIIMAIQDAKSHSQVTSPSEAMANWSSAVAYRPQAKSVLLIAELITTLRRNRIYFGRADEIDLPIVWSMMGVRNLYGIASLGQPAN